MPNLREKCGIFGVFAPGEDVARLTFFGIHALQHRGQESAGIAATDGRTITMRGGMGLVSQVFTEDHLEDLEGVAAIGHTRYSTTGASIECNTQPLVVSDQGDHRPLLDGEVRQLALAHNGNIVNADTLRADLESQGITFETTTDSEVIAQLLATAPGGTWDERFAVLMRRAVGAYSLTVLTRDALFGVRDPNGIRPLAIGRLNNGVERYVLASETCALDQIGAKFVREVEPGEVVRIDEAGLTSWFPAEPQRRALCLFEYTYFARLDSRMRGELLYQSRMNLGAELARQHPVEADVVIGVPDSATAAAIGYARESGIPYVEGIIKNRYVGRTFIQPDQRLRERGARLKYNPLPEMLAGKRVIVVDDSIVRGTTTPHVVAMIRASGATEVHMRITTPQIQHPCFYGVDMATKDQLIGAHMTVEQVREHIGADSLGHLTLDRTIAATNQPEGDLCTACFSGQYPGVVPLQLDKLALGAAEVPAAATV
jgi:amidophosphoribosyltransferase